MPLCIFVVLLILALGLLLIVANFPLESFSLFLFVGIASCIWGCWTDFSERDKRVLT